MQEGKLSEKENILRILKEVERAVKREDVITLKQLSNQTIHTASIEQEPDSITIAVIVYSLSKMIERKKYTTYAEWPSFYKSYISHINKAVISLEKNDIKGFRANINGIRKEINKLSGRFKKYIQDVFRKAEINKASRLYEHGISMEITAGLLGITLWELAEYAGQTGISDVDLTVTMPIEKRVRTAEEIFR